LRQNGVDLVIKMKLTLRVMLLAAQANSPSRFLG